MIQNSKPNILFIIIDSLRVDRIIGPLKTAKTTNFNKLINSGIFFDHTIASSDTTYLNVGSIFTSQYPFKSKIDVYNNHQKVSKFFQNLSENDFFKCALVPNTSFFRTITKNFEKTDFIEINPNQSLENGIGDKLLKQLETNSQKSPWIYYIHLLDLHPTKNKFLIPKKYSNEKFGQSPYDQTVSIIDDWLGKILENIDLNNTLIVVTSDHGEYISKHKELVYNVGNIEQTFKKLKKYFPFFESIGTKLFLTLRKIIFEKRKAKLKKSLNENEIRSLNSRLSWDLYDEIIRVPLIFAGYGINHLDLIDKQIHHMDIIPTINDLLQLSNEKNIDGRSLLPIMNGMILDEKPIYLENATNDPNSPSNVIGIRTPNYKMYKPRLDKKRPIKLFDLKNDSLELYNLSEKEPLIVKKLSKMMDKIQQSNFNNEKEFLKKRIQKKRKLLNLKE